MYGRYIHGMVNLQTNHNNNPKKKKEPTPVFYYPEIKFREETLECIFCLRKVYRDTQHLNSDGKWYPHDHEKETYIDPRNIPHHGDHCPDLNGTIEQKIFYFLLRIARGKKDPYYDGSVARWEIERRLKKDIPIPTIERFKNNEKVMLLIKSLKNNRSDIQYVNPEEKEIIEKHSPYDDKAWQSWHEHEEEDKQPANDLLKVTAKEEGYDVERIETSPDKGYTLGGDEPIVNSPITLVHKRIDKRKKEIRELQDIMHSLVHVVYNQYETDETMKGMMNEIFNKSAKMKDLQMQKRKNEQKRLEDYGIKY